MSGAAETATATATMIPSFVRLCGQGGPGEFKKSGRLCMLFWPILWWSLLMSPFFLIPFLQWLLLGYTWRWVSPTSSWSYDYTPSKKDSQLLIDAFLFMTSIFSANADNPTNYFFWGCWEHAIVALFKHGFQCLYLDDLRYVQYCDRRSKMKISEYFPRPLILIDWLFLCLQKHDKPLWLFPGLLKHEAGVWSCNMVGLFLGIYYTVQFIRNMPAGKSASVMDVSTPTLPGSVRNHVQGISAVFLGTLLLAFFKPFAERTTPLIGNIGVVVCLVMFASPLSVIKIVLDTKSAKAIPLPFTIISSLNCFMWSVYGWYVQCKRVHCSLSGH